MIKGYCVICYVGNRPEQQENVYFDLYGELS